AGRVAPPGTGARQAADPAHHAADRRGGVRCGGCVDGNPARLGGPRRGLHQRAAQPRRAADVPGPFRRRRHRDDGVPGWPERAVGGPRALRRRHRPGRHRPDAPAERRHDGGESPARPRAGGGGRAAGLPVYAGYVSQAQTEFLLGYRLTAGSFMQVASEEMHLTLLPAARASYAQENAALTAASARATGLPWIVVVLVLAIALGFVL